MRRASGRAVHEFSESADGIGEILLGYDGFVAHAEAVVVDRLWRTVEEFGNLDAVGDAQTHQA